ncbi:hypothetical protein C5Z25_00395 [Lactobacillus sp. CBA3605]|uniref:hypothetical protein n=1 Tax=Lactobacillus sp. CBA3605 TaxID=2099788 RepID=UPI000CFAD5C7|nr:hypothetical protein [Lactobacillus sp. CBA3605]AVK60328.1 hypothetical protein C5Z25_00395 [Lactobacillus sp. CBA3605]
MKKKQPEFDWLNRISWRVMGGLIASLLLVVGGMTQVAQAHQAEPTVVQTTSKNRHQVKRQEVIDSRSGALLLVATNENDSTTKVNEISIAFFIAILVIGGSCWYRARHYEK